jgi:hypothetical protein
MSNYCYIQTETLPGLGALAAIRRLVLEYVEDQYEGEDYAQADERPFDRVPHEVAETLARSFSALPPGLEVVVQCSFICATIAECPLYRDNENGDHCPSP